MIGFFDEYKLKTEADRKKEDKIAKEILKAKAAKGRISVEDLDGAAGEELVNLDAGVKTGKQANRILKSVMQVKNSRDRTDKIIIDRITNKNPRARNNANMLDFLNGVSMI